MLVRKSLVWPRKELKVEKGRGRGSREEQIREQRIWALVSGLTAVYSTIVSTFTESKMQFSGHICSSFLGRVWSVLETPR